jgi:hypothetical protein
MPVNHPTDNEGFDDQEPTNIEPIKHTERITPEWSYIIECLFSSKSFLSVIMTMLYILFHLKSVCQFLA